MAAARALEPVVVDEMADADRQEVAEIESLSFAAASSRHVRDGAGALPGARVDVARVDGRIVSFCNSRLVEDELHVINLATHPRDRDRGHATRLLAHVLDRARRDGCRRVLLEVRRSNQAARRLYRRFAFHTAGVRRRYYADDEDAVVLTLGLPPP